MRTASFGSMPANTVCVVAIGIVLAECAGLASTRVDGFSTAVDGADRLGAGVCSVFRCFTSETAAAPPTTGAAGFSLCDDSLRALLLLECGGGTAVLFRRFKSEGSYKDRGGSDRRISADLRVGFPPI